MSLQKYEKPRIREDGYKDLLTYNRKVFTARQTEALRSLYLWRDRVARQQDESTGFVCGLWNIFDSCKSHSMLLFVVF